MRRRKEYMPRTGIRFDRKSQHGGSAGFIGAEIDVVIFTGSVQPSLTELDGTYSVPAGTSVFLTGTTDITDSIGSFGTAFETKLLNASVLGSSGGGQGYTSTIVSARTGSIPSWTNSHLGRSSAFIIQVLSSSDHEVVSLNMWRSGTEVLEQSEVQASASLYYSKFDSYRHVVVKKTASWVDTTRLPLDMDGSTPVYFVDGKGTDITTVTGTLSYFSLVGNQQQGSATTNPAIIPIDVPHSGKIVDIKVWVEIVQTSGSTSTERAGRYPLGNFGISIRSPNLHGFHAHPIRNDPALKRVFASDIGEFSTLGSIGGVIGASLFGPNHIAPFYRDSFILFEGPSLFGEYGAGPWDVEEESGGWKNLLSAHYPSWQRDRGMRTVFSDGANIKNPRHHTNQVFAELDGNGFPIGVLKNSNSASFNGAPNNFFGLEDANGFDVPWTSETEISGAGTYVLAGSPPTGWLSGPGGSNNLDEWPTTGVNYGATHLMPLYPMLDPIYQRKRYNSSLPRRNFSTGSDRADNAIFDPEKWTGYRPGLRGTEASGTWHIMFYDWGLPRVDTMNYTPTYFRQVRLEFTLSSAPYIKQPGRGSSNVRGRRTKNEVLIHSISGSDAIWDSTGSWDSFISDTYLYQDDTRSETGRTVGVALFTGSIENSDFALYYRLSGSLAGQSGSVPGWLLANEFGMPRIPESSASLVEVSTEPVVGVNPQVLLTVRPLLDGARRLSDAASDAQPRITRESYAAKLISGSLK